MNKMADNVLAKMDKKLRCTYSCFITISKFILQVVMTVNTVSYTIDKTKYQTASVNKCHDRGTMKYWKDNKNQVVVVKILKCMIISKINGNYNKKSNMNTILLDYTF